MQLRQFIYLEERRFIFVSVPKVACTNWKALCRYLSGHADYLDSGLAHNRVKSGLSYLSNFHHWEEILCDPKIFKFAFVRNPFTRALSAYLNKIEPFVRGEDWQSKHYRAVYMAIDNYRQQSGRKPVGVTFRLFLEWIANSGHPRVEDPHWLPQSLILEPSVVSYDFIGRFENLQTDARLVLRQIGCDIAFPTQEDLEFPSTNAANLLDGYYLDEELDLVRQIYRDDFISFGYSNELPLPIDGDRDRVVRCP